MQKHLKSAEVNNKNNLKLLSKYNAAKTGMFVGKVGIHIEVHNGILIHIYMYLVKGMYKPIRITQTD